MPSRKPAVPRPKKVTVTRDTTTATRTPVKAMRAQVAPHPKTLANGKPRPKKRG